MHEELIPIKRLRLWFLVAIVFKLLLFWFFKEQSAELSDVQLNEYGITITKDYSELLGPVDHLVDYGTYSLEPNSDKAYAGRLPGYSVAYLLFRFWLNKDVALLFLILSQIILSAFALVKISETIAQIGRQKWLFWASLLGLGFLSYSLPWESWTYPESFALSAWLLSLHYFHRSGREMKTVPLLWAGFFAAWAFFLRGFLGVYFLSFAFIFFLRLMGSLNSKKVLIKGLIFLMPLVIMESTWVIRNKISLGKIVLLQTSFGWSELEQEYPIDKVYKPSMLELRKLIASWGGDNVHFYPGSDMSYFTKEKIAEDFFPFSKDLFFNGFSQDSLIALRRDVQRSLDQQLPMSERLIADASIAERSQRYAEIFKKHKAFRAYLIAPILRAKNLIVHNVTGNWPGPSFSASPLWYKGWKLGVLGLYFGAILSGALIFLIIIWFRSMTEWAILSGFSALTLLLSFMFLINTAEFKYFMTAWANLLVIMLSATGYFVFLRSEKVQKQDD